MGKQQKTFCQASLQYVAEIQAIQERIKFEFVETLSSFLYNWLSFYHVGHMIHQDFSGRYNDINGKVQKAKENFETTLVEADELKRKMLALHMKNAVSLLIFASVCKKIAKYFKKRFENWRMMLKVSDDNFFIKWILK